MSSPVKVHVLYEHTLHPHSSAFIRLLQPLKYHSLRAHVQVTTGVGFDGRDVDILIVDRLWHPKSITTEDAKALVNEIRLSGTKFVYALDDNYFDIPANHRNLPTKEQLWIVEYFLRTADMIWVTTPYLKERFQPYNPHIKILPNCLDERLLIPRGPYTAISPFQTGKRVIGYMGTYTHDEDLLMVIPALKVVCARHPEVVIQLIGVAGYPETRAQLADLPVQFIHPRADESVYPQFMLWFTGWVNWNIAIAPLTNTDFNASKSDIKYLDYSAIGASGVFSDVSAYQNSVQHLETGWLVPNHPDAWEEAFEALLSDEEQRKSLAANAQDYVFSKRVLKHRAMDWLNAIRHVLAQ